MSGIILSLPPFFFRFLPFKYINSFNYVGAIFIQLDNIFTKYIVFILTEFEH